MNTYLLGIIIGPFNGCLHDPLVAQECVMAVTKFRCEWRLSGFVINSLAIKIMIFILCRIPVVVIRDRR